MATSDDDSQIDLVIRNVVASFTVKCHLDLKRAAMHLCHVVYERNKGCLLKQMRNPSSFLSIWSQGKIIIKGCKSEAASLQAARRCARQLQRVFPQVRFCNFQILNIMATCKLPFGVKIQTLAGDFSKEAKYEPEISPGLVWTSESPKATIRIHTTGSITITGATSVGNVGIVMERLYPILSSEKYRTQLRRASPSPDHLSHSHSRRKRQLDLLSNNNHPSKKQTFTNIRPHPVLDRRKLANTSATRQQTRDLKVTRGARNTMFGKHSFSEDSADEEDLFY